MYTRSGRNYASGLKVLPNLQSGEGERGDGSGVACSTVRNQPVVNELNDKPFTIGMFRKRNQSERKRQQDMRARYERSLRVNQERFLQRRGPTQS